MHAADRIRTACFIVLLLSGAAATSCGRAKELMRFEYRQRHMGTEARIVLFASDSVAAGDAVRSAFARIAQLEQMLSDYRLDSEVSRLSEQAGGAPVVVSADLFAVLQRGLALSGETHGAFDVTVGPMTLLWRKARQSGVMPDSAELAEAKKRVGWTRVTLDSARRTVRLAAEGMRLDFGGIGKGFAADAALAILRGKGVERALVAVGGDIVAGQAPPGQSGWQVTVEHAESAHRVVFLQNEAISTSGDTQQFLERNGVRYSHVLDPRTGMPRTHRLGVTVRSRRGVDADAFATALSVLAPDAQQAFVAAHPEATFYIRPTN
jgi:thiamine biosynthesis lipoprotein